MVRTWFSLVMGSMGSQVGGSQVRSSLVLGWVCLVRLVWGSQGLGPGRGAQGNRVMGSLGMDVEWVVSLLGPAKERLDSTWLVML